MPLSALWRHRAGTARRVISIAIVMSIAGVVSVAGVNAWFVSRAFDERVLKIESVFPENEAKRPPALTAEGVPATSPPVAGEAPRPQNILILGSDTRGSINGSLAELRAQRSDTMMVAHIPADRQKLFIMSIPRDAWLNVDPHGQVKINAALSYGGVPRTVQAVEGLLGARIDHVAVVNVEGFNGLTEALGGVDIDNPEAFQAITAGEYVFPKGEQHLDGRQALAYVRERAAFEDGDFQRIRNQHILLKALMSKTMQRNVLTNPEKLTNLLDSVAPYVAVDEGMNAAYLATLAVELRDVRADDVTFFTMPTKGIGRSDDGQLYVFVDWDGLLPVQKAFQTDTLDTYTPELQTIDG